MTSNWRKFLDLSRRDRRQFVEAAVLLAVIRAALKVLPFRNLQSLLTRLARAPVDTPRGPDEIRRARHLASIVRAAGAHGPAGFNCLRESLVLWFMLRRDDLPGELRIGVRKTGHEFSAHAWVELNGRVLNDTNDVHERFSAFERAVGDV